MERLKFQNDGSDDHGDLMSLVLHEEEENKNITPEKLILLQNNINIKEDNISIPLIVTSSPINKKHSPINPLSLLNSSKLSVVINGIMIK